MLTQLEIGGKQRDPNLKDTSLARMVKSTYKGFHSTVAAFFSYSGLFVRLRVPSFATQESRYLEAMEHELAFFSQQETARHGL